MTTLHEIDREHWQFILFESEDGELFVDMVYSPVSVVDTSMLIRLNDDEIEWARNDRTRFVEHIGHMRYYFTRYIERSEDYNQFVLNTKKPNT